MSEVEIAERIAREAHAGQKESSTGDDYIFHVSRVVDLVNSPEAKATAWLHDVLEDSCLTARDLLVCGISHPVVRAVRLLSRLPETSYSQYIADLKVSRNPLALEVKIADLRDHLRPNCPESLRPRYELALKLLAEPAKS